MVITYFLPPLYVAARTGQADMLQVFQEHLPQFEPSSLPHNPSAWRSKIGPGSLSGAATRGNMDMVWLCLYPPSRIIPDGGDKGENKMPILGYKPGPVPPNLTLWNYIVDEIRRTRSPKVYRYLMNLLADTPKFDRGMMNYQLAGMAWAGDMTMVWYLLDIGANPSAETTTGQGTPPRTRRQGMRRRYSSFASRARGQSQQAWLVPSWHNVDGGREGREHGDDAKVAERWCRTQ